MDKWGYSYLIELKTLREKEKLLGTSNFSFSHYVFKSCLLLMRQNEYLWSKGLIKVIWRGLDSNLQPFLLKHLPVICWQTLSQADGNQLLYFGQEFIVLL